MQGGDWWYIGLSDPAAGDLGQLQDEFTAMWTALGAPNGVAMFADRRSRRAIHAYFTPEAGARLPVLMQRYGARRCDPPKEAAFLTGDEDKQRVPPPNLRA